MVSVMVLAVRAFARLFMAAVGQRLLLGLFGGMLLRPELNELSTVLLHGAASQGLPSPASGEDACVPSREVAAVASK
jgi:hypothetical protein